MLRQILIFGLVLGQLAILKISEIKLKYATFESKFFEMFSWAKQIKIIDFLDIVVCALKSYIT